MREIFRIWPVLILLLVASGCREAGIVSQTLPPPSVHTIRKSFPSQQVFTPTISGEKHRNSAQTSEPALAATQNPFTSQTQTPDPLEQWTVEGLRSRDYGGGIINIEETLAENSLFTRYLIFYESDGLTIYGFMNVPVGTGPFPVVISIHGYIDPQDYSTLDYTTRYADDLARRGFIVIHPNLRNYPPSDLGENLFRVGMAADILNLLAIIQDEAGRPGPLEELNPAAIGLWGHSMGGGISTRVMTVSKDVSAVVLYAAMSGNEKKNFEAIFTWSDGERGAAELSYTPAQLNRINPENYFRDISAAVSIHHGEADQLVPVQWSRETCEVLEALKKNIECIFYPGMSHTFWGDSDLLFMENVAEFFRQNLVDDSL